MKKSETISERIVRLRAERNLTQAEIGRALEVSKNYIYLIESGAKIPAEKFIRKLDRFEAGESNFPRMVEESTDIRSPQPWKSAPTQQLEDLLTQCVSEKDYGAVSKVADELLNRKIQEKLK